MVDFQVQHLRLSSRQLLTPLTREDTTPKLSAMISPEDLALPPKPQSITPTALRPSEFIPDQYLSVMIAMVEYLSGKSLNPYSGDPRQSNPSSDKAEVRLTSAELDLSEMQVSAGTSQSQSATTSDTPVDSGEFLVRVTDAERLTFSLNGEVTTSDGQMFTVQLAESHQRSSRQTLSISASQAAQLIDPLIINLQGSVAFEADNTEFDLNSDGNTESFRQLARGSYFLALDLNNDGVINNGNELFGTQSGNGFVDLRHYDDDGNGLIDSGDAVFERLRLFRTDSDQLMSLSEQQIVAIGLHAKDTPFTFSDSQGNNLGQLRQSSFYLRSNGNHGTVQHIDLAV